MTGLNESWYSVKEAAEKVWQIDDNGEDTIYLIEGNDKALLIDTGWGIGNLPKFVSAITPLPVIAVNTHCHPDHVCGNHQFDRIYIHRNDAAMMKGNFTREARLWMLDNILTRRVPYDFNKEAWINADLNSVSYFTENQVFDLGGRIVKVIETPGHTPGSICLFVENEGLLFSGDSVEQGDIWLHCEECMPLCIYQNSITKLLNIPDEIDYIFPSHGKTPIPPKILFEINDGIEKIKSGKRKGAAIETFFGKGLSCAFESFGIIYREDNIYPAGKG